MTARRLTRAAVLLAGAGVLAVFVAALCWRAGGGRWFAVETPSMGRAAPVGTLLLTRPVELAEVHVGDVVTFRAPTSGEVYSHRVVAVTDGGLMTRGDINGVDDPWTLTGKDLIGRVVARWWACGWLLKAVPVYLILLAGVWLLTSWLRSSWRAPARMVGNSLAAGLVSAWLHPWTAVVKLGTTTEHGHTMLRVVSTGLLPITLADAGGGPSVRLVDGQVGLISIRHAAGGRFGVSASLGLTAWWWVGAIAVCLLPMLWTTLVGLAPAEPDPAWDVLAEEQAQDPIDDDAFARWTNPVIHVAAGWSTPVLHVAVTGGAP